VNYEVVATRFPHSDHANLRLAVAAYETGDYLQSVHALNELAGKQISREMAAEANALGRKLETPAKSAPATKP